MKERTKRIIAMFFALNILFEVISPTVALALTGGPSQPEVQAFTPVGTSEMVNLFSGDMNYNIPLLDIEGYPVNLAYNAGNSPDQEASWVGLGWNINPGTVNRGMRGLPDDFKDDEIEKEMNMKPNQTFGISASPGLELLGVDASKAIAKKLKLSFGLSYNTYNGYAVDMSARLQLGTSEKNKTGYTGSLGLSSGTGKGLGITASVSYNKKQKTTTESNFTTNDRLSNTLGLGYNSVRGMQAITFNSSLERSKEMTKGKNTGKKRSGDFNGEGSFDFANPTYLPTSSSSMVNMGLSVGITFGGELTGSHPKGSISAYYSGQFIRDKNMKFKAYGYMYSDAGNDGFREDLLHDFNREKDAGFNMQTPNLPVTNYSYDSYSYSGQGISGNFRPFRNDIGTVFDPYVKNFPDINANVGIELGVGNTAHTGVNVALMFSRTKTGKWVDRNEARKEAVFRGKQAGIPENIYFKQGGEKTAEVDMAYFNNVINRFSPIRFGLQKVGPEAACTKEMLTKYGGSNNLGYNLKSTRTRRNNGVTVLTGAQAQTVGLETQIKSYTQNDFSIYYTGGCGGCITPISRTLRGGHHVSEITTVRDDGARYVYGIPAYNNEQKEVCFAVDTEFGGSTVNYGKGEVTYPSGDDNLNNNQGLDHYFQRQKIPAYAHSYLLSAVLSSDYVDRTNNGPTNDDYGKYTKINYSRIHSNYGWRTPYGAYKGSYNAGLKSSKGKVGDDKANYVKGNKEIWMMHSIESKNYVAVFQIGGRADAHGTDPTADGGLPTNSVIAQSYSLTEIRLYSKQELLDNGTNAVPLKTVHFEYDYSLCQNIENTSNTISGTKGKLTLKKVWFTYQGSSKGRLSPYEFTYGSNPNYNLKGYDRWGTFQTYTVPLNYNPENAANNPLADEFPYTNQNEISPSSSAKLADTYAEAWNLTNIKLPSGGEIQITYEADDYAFVQDKRASRMFLTAGASNSATPLPAFGDISLLHEGNGVDHNHIFLKITNSETLAINSMATVGQNTVQAVRNLFFRDENGTDMKYLYFRFLVNVERNMVVYTPKWEYVSGYAEIDYNTAPDIVTVSGTKYLRVTVKSEPIFDNLNLPAINVNPMAMAGINFVRKYIPRIAYDNYQDPFGGPLNILSLVSAIKSSITPIVQFFKGGLSNALRLSKASGQFQARRSFVRLYAGDCAKKGGGHRVKRVELSDKWQSISGNVNNQDNAYGQEYFYTTKDKYGRIISSGVASYEPLIGGDENPFRQPVFYDNSEKKKWKLAPDDDSYHEEPYGEAMFPGPSVGYSRVTVRNLVKDNGPLLVRRHATGAVVHEFYTSKDFPTLTDRTEMKKERHKPNPVAKFLKFFVKDYMTVSQGYQVVLNDMHGKPKGQWVYKEPDAALPSADALKEYFSKDYISGIEYKYKRNKNRLINNVDVIQKTGQIENAMVGVDYDMVVDTKDSQTWTANATTNGNLEGFFIAIFPGLVPTIFPGYNQEKVKFRSSVITKVLYQYGMLEETVAYDNGASVSTVNKLWDAETGEVVSTETVNNFNDKLYNLTYPAHWAYDRMGQSGKNILAASQISGGNLSQPSIFIEGDEVLLEGSSSTKAWVSKVSPSVVMIDNLGNAINLANYTLAMVVRSGNRNQQNIPVAKVVSLVNPVSNNTIAVDKTSKVINTSAAEFKDNWPVFCNCNVTPGSKINPYLNGQLGNWRPSASYVYLTGREQSKQNQNTNLRKDGPYLSYVPFWTPNPSQAPNNWSKTADPSWQFTSKMTVYTPFGFELENKDALGRNSAAIYGYHTSLPIAVSSNAMYRQVAYDGLEDYDYNNPCENDHFSFIDSYNKVSNNFISKPNSQNQKYAHTGRKSMKVPPLSAKTVTATLCNPNSQ